MRIFPKVTVRIIVKVIVRIIVTISNSSAFGQTVTTVTISTEEKDGSTDEE